MTETPAQLPDSTGSIAQDVLFDDAKRALQSGLVGLAEFRPSVYTWMANQGYIAVILKANRKYLVCRIYERDPATDSPGKCVNAKAHIDPQGLVNVSWHEGPSQ
jgi:hypothetical protein